MTGLRWTLYGLGFLAELLAWAGCGATAFLFLTGAGAWALAAAITVGVVVIWGLVMAPKAVRPLPTAAYYAVKGVLYAWAAVVWALLVPWLAVAFVVLVAVSEPALYRRRQQAQASR